MTRTGTFISILASVALVACVFVSSSRAAAINYTAPRSGVVLRIANVPNVSFALSHSPATASELQSYRSDGSSYTSFVMISTAVDSNQKNQKPGDSDSNKGTPNGNYGRHTSLQRQGLTENGLRI